MIQWDHIIILLGIIPTSWPIYQASLAGECELLCVFVQLFNFCTSRGGSGLHLYVQSPPRLYRKHSFPRSLKANELVPCYFLWTYKDLPWPTTTISHCVEDVKQGSLWGKGQLYYFFLICCIFWSELWWVTAIYTALSVARNAWLGGAKERYNGAHHDLPLVP